MKTGRLSLLRVPQWRKGAEFLHDEGDPNNARLWQLAAVELERALKALGEGAVTLGGARSRVLSRPTARSTRAKRRLSRRAAHSPLKATAGWMAVARLAGR